MLPIFKNSVKEIAVSGSIADTTSGDLAPQCMQNPNFATGRRLQHLPNDVGKDAAVLVIGDFEWSVDPGDGGECLFFSVGIARANLDLLSRLEILSETLEVEYLEPCEAKRL